ncbi:AbrB/MazE/SpoVT family DNA-binding domain-containing protein [archaeon]|jgi:AbrB family looped-hinge helix DNA binding protein|nr:AbrB/MazE/SpoVT family DNA-binding domain-containing protein [archaeon]MBT4351767.1 AbrB/MazE/SpoVT family DNA-binding domain-containing protein [archaeon]MBT4647873.1 AbrB/MazE/SpoVT family DNA-binding domain-containing protein [archaeon]MBT6821073.1 AbrB/MazE/SpoVT family DNA-binding domain-containing protein [archaeon]MBT7392008.1 AbrB/MazE/SpoVT family DNA-binding domain-containing protein [archaeon]
MKKYPKVIQPDSRGQIVIPKDIRSELGIDESTAFWIYSITNEGILLKKVDTPNLSKNDKIIKEISDKSKKIKIDKKNIDKTIKQYKKTKDGNLDLI